MKSPFPVSFEQSASGLSAFCKVLTGAVVSRSIVVFDPRSEYKEDVAMFLANLVAGAFHRGRKRTILNTIDRVDRALRRSRQARPRRRL